MSASESPVISTELIRQVEMAINRVSGMISSKVVTDSRGAIIEIHALYEGKRAPKYVAQDIQSLLETRWDLRVNKKIISVAQVSDEKPKKPVRLQIYGLETRTRNLQFEVSVELALNGTLKKGTFSGPDTATNKMTIIANAALKAVAEYLPEEYQLLLEATSIERVGRKDVVVAIVTILAKNHQETLIGTCVVERDLIISTVKATLDSLNRRFGILAVVD